MKKILLLDIENIGQRERDLTQYLCEYHRIYLVYAKECTKISLEEFIYLAPHLVSGKLKILKMSRIGKNAADIGLAFIAGKLSKKKKKYEFHIMSNDHSMEYVVELLNLEGSKASLIRTKSLDPIVPVIQNQVVQVESIENKDLTSFSVESESINLLPTKKVISSPEDVFDKFCSYVVKSKIPKPSKEVGLINTLKSMSKNSDYSGQVLIMLKSKNMVQINNKQVIYNDREMKKHVNTLTLND